MKKRIISVLLLICVALPLFVTAYAAEGFSLKSGLDWRYADDFGANDNYIGKPKTGYAFGYYTIDNGDGTLSALHVPHRSDKAYFERYDAAGNVVFSKTIDLELPIFGSFIADGEFFYLALGQKNDAENDAAEVWRIVKYDRNWQRLGAASANGGETYTTEPFNCTVSRMTVSDDGKTLVLYAARQRYTSDDGRRHQSNITFFLNTETMEWEEIWGEEFPVNHVSHSFGQFVRFDEDGIATVDHGDAYPRSFVLQTDDFSSDLLMISGAVGDNVTNAIGSGFEISDDGYLFLGCSSPQTKAGAWNVFLAYSEKIGEIPTSMTFDGVTVSTVRPTRFSGTMWTVTIKGVLYYITGASDGDEAMEAVYAFIDALVPEKKLSWLTSSKTDIDCARLVKLGDDEFVAMWGCDDGVHWQLLNGKGELLGEENVMEDVPMPSTDPVVLGDSVRWIQVSGNKPYIFTLTVGGSEDEPETPEADEPDEPDEPEMPETNEPDEPEMPGEDPLYTDIPEEISVSDWAKTSVIEALNRGIIPDSLPKNYKRSITRLDFCHLAYNVFCEVTGSEPTARLSFTDTDDECVEKLAALGVINGIGGDKFDPYGTLTREQAATILARLAAAAGYALPHGEADFDDMAEAGGWATESIGMVSAAGIMNGTGGGLFSPKLTYSAEQSIVTLVRLLGYIEK